MLSIDVVHTWNSSPLRSNLLRLQCTCCTVPTTSARPHRSPLLWACQWPSTQSLSSSQLSHNESLWALEITKSHREQGLGYREAGECLDAHLGQVVCDKDRVVDWCIVSAEMPLTRFKECWPPSWTPLKPQHSNPNPNPLANQLWCIDFLTPSTPLIIPHRLPAFLESLIPLKNSCSIHARWSKSCLKHSIPFCRIFSKFKTEFYCISFF